VKVVELLGTKSKGNMWRQNEWTWNKRTEISDLFRGI